jgi:hypothetical protein
MPMVYTNLEIKLNRLYSQKAVLEQKLKRSENDFRKKRTRTLIQMGGLLELTPLPAICDINIGDDLQIDKPNNAAILLGMLADFANQIPDSIPSENLQKFANIGKSLLKRKS